MDRIVQRFLLISVLLFSVVFCTETNKLCGSEFVDVQSRAVQASVVVEASVDTTFERDPVTQRFNVSIGIRKIIRGSIGAELLRADRLHESDTQRSRRRALSTLTIGEFGPENDDLCLTERPSLIIGGQRFVFFLSPTSNETYYKQTSLPVQSTKTVLRSIRKILCTDCVSAPKIRHSNKAAHKTVLENSEHVRLRCRVSGMPPPLVVWMKDEQVLRRRKAMRIRNSNETDDEADEKSSVLRLRRVRLKDAGRYACIARNIAGEVRKEFYLSVEPESAMHSSISTPSISQSSSPSSVTTSPTSSMSSLYISPTPVVITSSAMSIPASGHYYPCVEQTYCLNGGVCVYLPEFNAEHCRCPANYMGKRCEIRDIFTLLREITSAESEAGQKRVYIIVGVVLGVVVLIVIAVAVCFKKRCTTFHKRQARKDDTHVRSHQANLYSPMRPIDRVDGRALAPPRTISTSSQTDAIDFVPIPNLYHPHHNVLHNNYNNHIGFSVDGEPTPAARGFFNKPHSRLATPTSHSRLATPTSRSSFHGIDSPDISIDGVSARSDVLYDSGQIISDIAGTETDEDENNADECIPDLSLDDKLSSVPATYRFDDLNGYKNNKWLVVADINGCGSASSAPGDMGVVSVL